MPDFIDATVGQAFNPIVQKFINSMFLLRPDNMIRILNDYGINNISKRDLTEEKDEIKKSITSLRSYER